MPGVLLKHQLLRALVIHKYEDQGTHMDDIGSGTEAFTQKDVVRKPTGMGEDKPSSTD